MPRITGTGYCRSGSDEGRQALPRRGVSSPARPVVALYNVVVLVHPGQRRCRRSARVDVRPAELAYDVIFVETGRAVGDVWHGSVKAQAR
jgi:hypothetical protein